MHELKRGSIFWTKLPILGGKDRPAIIISNDNFNDYSDSVTVIPFSTSVDNCVSYGLHRKVKLANKFCQTLPEYTCTVPKSDVTMYITMLEPEIMDAIMLDLNTHYGNAPTMESSELLRDFASAISKLPGDYSKLKTSDKLDLLRIWKLVSNSPVDQYLLANKFTNGDKNELVSLLSELETGTKQKVLEPKAELKSTPTNLESKKELKTEIKSEVESEPTVKFKPTFSYELDEMPVMSPNGKYPNKIVTSSKSRWSYAHVWEPTSINGGTPKYSLTVLIPKDDISTINKIKSGIMSAYLNDTSKLSQGGYLPQFDELRLPVRDGDTERPNDPDYANCWFLNTTSNTAPGIVDINRRPISDHSAVYSGVYGRVSISFYAYAKETNGTWAKGIACGLCNLQKVKDGELLGGWF